MAAMVAVQKVSVTATTIGERPLRAGVQAEVRARRLGSVIRLTGHLTNAEVFAHLREADAFLFLGRVAGSGDRAGFPNAVAEAMAVGVPVIARPVGGVTEVIVDGENGLLAREPALARRLRNNARAWIEAHFDARRNMQTLLDLLDSGSGVDSGPLPEERRRAGPLLNPRKRCGNAGTALASEAKIVFCKSLSEYGICPNE